MGQIDDVREESKMTSTQLSFCRAASHRMKKCLVTTTAPHRAAENSSYECGFSRVVAVSAVIGTVAVSRHTIVGGSPRIGRVRLLYVGQERFGF